MRGGGLGRRWKGECSMGAGDGPEESAPCHPGLGGGGPGTWAGGVGGPGGRGGWGGGRGRLGLPRIILVTIP
jgi:hypothetical protein